MNRIPGSYGALNNESQDASANPSVLSPPEDVHPSSPILIRALDEALSVKI